MIAGGYSGVMRGVIKFAGGCGGFMRTWRGYHILMWWGYHMVGL
jgi:hypothetical protein